MGGVSGIKFIKKDAKFILEKMDLSNFLETKNIYVAGSYRRDCVYVNDLDFIVDTDSRVEVLRHLQSKFGNDFERVRGDFLTGKICQYKLDLKSFKMRQESIKMDFKFVSEGEVPFMLLHFTGSNFLNIAIRNKAEKQGYKLNEYGLYDTRTSEKVQIGQSGLKLKNGKILKGLNHEGDIFNILGYEYIPTNLRSANSIAEAFTILREFQL